MKTRESESDHPRLLTSSARNDAAVGLFVGFVSTLLVVTALFWLADRLAPHSAGGVSGATFRHETLVQMWLFLALSMPAAIAGAGGFVWLRQRAPAFARGYRAGCLFTVAFWGLFFVPTFLA